MVICFADIFGTTLRLSQCRADAEQYSRFHDVVHGHVEVVVYSLGATKLFAPVSSIQRHQFPNLGLETFVLFSFASFLSVHRQVTSIRSYLVIGLTRFLSHHFQLLIHLRSSAFCRLVMLSSSIRRMVVSSFLQFIECYIVISAIRRLVTLSPAIFPVLILPYLLSVKRHKW